MVKELKGYEGNKLTFSVTEGRGVPMLIVYGEPQYRGNDLTRKFESFVFDSPKQVRELITLLEPFAQ